MSFVPARRGAGPPDTATGRQRGPPGACAPGAPSRTRASNPAGSGGGVDPGSLSASGAVFAQRLRRSIPSAPPAPSPTGGSHGALRRRLERMAGLPRPVAHAPDRSRRHRPANVADRMSGATGTPHGTWRQETPQQTHQPSLRSAGGDVTRVVGPPQRHAVVDERLRTVNAAVHAEAVRHLRAARPDALRPPAGFHAPQDRSPARARRPALSTGMTNSRFGWPGGERSRPADYGRSSGQSGPAGGRPANSGALLSGASCRGGGLGGCPFAATGRVG